LRVSTDQIENGLLVQIHDELLFLVRAVRLPHIAAVIKETMQSAAAAPGLWNLLVAMPVKLQVGPSWGELAEYLVDT
jgi:DNA polymerase I-like protein with 3'-5' exonuclease and polymerase domains